ncbi:MAG: helix-turn-helix domain-containing protein, partial [Planctomycetes bacterium]|nr:helix-turn-helix domain-containing protein [Planctomycetota bacterium]
MAFQKDYVRRHEASCISYRVTPRFVDFHRLQMSGAYEYPSHRHTSYEVIMIERGPYRCILNGCELEVGNKFFLIVKPGDNHQDHLRDGQLHYVLHFTLEQPLFAQGVLPTDQVSSGRFAEGLKFFADLEHEIKRGDTFSGYLQDSLLETFFWRLLRLLPREAVAPGLCAFSEQHRFIKELHGVFEKFYKRNARVDEIAEELKISRRTLSTRCQAYLQESPANAFNRYRIEKAAALLRYTELSIQQ